MAASATDDIQTQLAVLLGRQAVHIRKTDENSPRISIIGVIAAVNVKDKNHAAEDLRRLAARHPTSTQIALTSNFEILAVGMDRRIHWLQMHVA